MSIVNWRREGLFLSIAGMETCWIAGWSRVALRQLGQDGASLSWWSVLTLYIVALATVRTLGRLELRHKPWFIGGVALLTSLLLVQVNLYTTDGPLDKGWVLQTLLSERVASSATGVIWALLLGLLVWFRSLRIPAHAGNTRDMARQFQIGVLIMAGLVLVTLLFSISVTGLAVAYFCVGLLAAALTRIEEVARTEFGGVAPLDLKWAMILAVTFIVAGTVVLSVTRVITVETMRELLQPLANILSIALQAFVMSLFVLVESLLSLFSGCQAASTPATTPTPTPLPTPDKVNEFVERLKRSGSPATIRPGLLQALQILFVAALIFAALWRLTRSFLQWRMARYATPGGERESVSPAGTLAKDLAEFFQDRWQRLRTVDLRRLFRRRGIGSVRAIYANLLALLTAADRPRQPEQTPYEYKPVAEEALPASQAEITAITEAYVHAHYGEMEISAEELAHLQEAWERVRAEGQELL